MDTANHLVKFNNFHILLVSWTSTEHEYPLSSLLALNLCLCWWVHFQVVKTEFRKPACYFHLLRNAAHCLPGSTQQAPSSWTVWTCWHPRGAGGAPQAASDPTAMVRKVFLRSALHTLCMFWWQQRKWSNDVPLMPMSFNTHFLYQKQNVFNRNRILL